MKLSVGTVAHVRQIGTFLVELKAPEPLLNATVSHRMVLDLAGMYYSIASAFAEPVLQDPHTVPFCGFPQSVEPLPGRRSHLPPEDAQRPVELIGSAASFHSLSWFQG